MQLVINARDRVVLDALAVHFLCEPDLDCDRGRGSWQQEAICCDCSVTRSLAIVLACTECKGYIVEGMWKPFVSLDCLEEV